MHVRAAIFAAALTVALAVEARSPNQFPFDASRLSDHVRTLSSDEFAGRGPGTVGEVKTIDYIVGHFKAAGLQPRGDIVDGERRWTQAVPLMKSDIVGSPNVTIRLADETISLTQGEEAVIRPPLNGAKTIDLVDVPMIFVGCGVSAPERGWDDFKGLNAMGKLLVVLSNDPDFEGGEGEFGGKAMTYYGRWTYKFEEAARRGAAGVLVIHESGPSAYGWNTVSNSTRDTQFDTVSAEPGAAHARVEGWIQRDLAVRLFQASRLELEKARAIARTRAFTPVPLKAQLSVRLTADVRAIRTHNVVGYLPGTKYPDETVIYTAHWDHLGIGQPDQDGDRIYNGAYDNASGVAQLIEQAHAFAQSPRPDRSIVFLSPAAEEVGLLGSKYYAGNPLFPIGKTVGVIDADGGQLWGKTRNFSVSGNPRVGLVDRLIEEGRKHGRYYSSDPHPEAGNFYRSDPFAFARAGIPAIAFEGGKDLVDGGTARGDAMRQKFLDEGYHQPNDEWSPEWDFSGMADDNLLLHEVGRNLANSRLWPEWGADSEFRRMRDESARDRE